MILVHGRQSSEALDDRGLRILEHEARPTHLDGRHCGDCRRCGRISTYLICLIVFSEMLQNIYQDEVEDTNHYLVPGSFVFKSKHN